MSDNTTAIPRNIAQESESEFLEHEAQQARQGIERSIEELKASLQTATDLRLWAQHHPWLTVGAAGAAGLAAGAAITGAMQGGGERRNGPPQNGQYAAAYGPQPQQQPSALWSGLMGPMFDLAKVAIQSAIASAMGGAMQAKAQEEAQDPTQGVRVEEPVPMEF